MAATLSVFFSYIDQDLAYANQITLLLKSLRHDFRIEVTSQQPQPNDSTADPNLAALRDCELAIVLLSRAYLRSEYMRRRLLPAIVGRMQAKRCLVLPIYIEATGRDASALTGTRVASIPHQPLKSYADPAQGLLIVENSLRKFLQGQGYSRFDRAGIAFWKVVALAVLGLTLLGGLLYWRETREKPSLRPPQQVVSEPGKLTDSAITSGSDPIYITGVQSRSPPSAPCLLPPRFAGPTACIAAPAGAGGYRICKADRIFYVLTPDCETRRLQLSVDEHHRIYESLPFVNGQATLLFRDDPQSAPYPALRVDIQGRVVKEW